MNCLRFNGSTGTTRFGADGGAADDEHVHASRYDVLDEVVVFCGDRAAGDGDVRLLHLLDAGRDQLRFDRFGVQAPVTTGPPWRGTDRFVPRRDGRRTVHNPRG